MKTLRFSSTSEVPSWNNDRLQKVEKGPNEHPGSKLCQKGLQLKSLAMEGGHCND